jgi:uncharacterized protein (UPF0305 family)
MCDKCTELDEKIERYRRLDAEAMDDLMSERISGLIAELVAIKSGLHPVGKGWPGSIPTGLV